MTIIKHRSALLASALAALLVSALMATGPPAPAAAAVTACQPVVWGLHGMGEGPPRSKQYPYSPELFDFDTSGKVPVLGIPYTPVTASNWDVLDSVSLGPLTDAANDGERTLQYALTSYTKICTPAHTKIALVGYSMGAWVVNKWLVDHPDERTLISAVVLYGDPCWVNGSDAGLLRLLPSYNPSHGCLPANNYPYPAPAPGGVREFQVQSWCLYHDPVCGGGYGSLVKKSKRDTRLTLSQKREKAAYGQLNLARQCEKTHCPHGRYRIGDTGEGLLKAGAQFVTQQLTG